MIFRSWSDVGSKKQRAESSGFVPTSRAKLFEPLFTTKTKGIGLGLAKTLVEGHGGTIEVESEVIQGSTFTIELPLVKNGEAA